MHAVLDTVFEVSSFQRFQYLELSSSYAREGIVRPYWRMLYVDKGSALLILDGVEYSVSAGHALICKPDQELTGHVQDKLAANLYLIGFALDKGDLSPYAGQVLPVTTELHAHIKLILKEAKFAYRNDLRDLNYLVLEPSADAPFGSEQMMKLLMEQALIYIARSMQVTQSRSYPEIVRENLLMVSIGVNPYFDKLLRYLEQNIHECLTIDDICRDCFTSRSKIQRIFRECVGEGVISFHQRLKIEYSKIMIRQSELNLTQIAEVLGFSSVHHFSKKFKQLVKMPPSEYARFAK